MITETIIIVFLVLVAIVLLKLLKGMLKIVMVALVIAGISLVVFALLFARDFNDVRQNLGNSSLLILLQNDGKIVAGFTSNSLSASNVTFLNSSQVSDIRTMVFAGNMKGVLGNHYRIIQATPLIFEPLPETITSGNKAYKKSFLIGALESEEPKEYYVNEMFSDMTPQNKDVIKNTLGDPVELKSQLFALMFQKIYEQKGMVYIFVEYKQEHISVYPETISFKTLKKLPTSYAKDKFSELVTSAKGKVSEKVS